MNDTSERLKRLCPKIPDARCPRNPFRVAGFHRPDHPQHQVWKDNFVDSMELMEHHRERDKWERKKSKHYIA